MFLATDDPKNHFCIFRWSGCSKNKLLWCSVNEDYVFLGFRGSNDMNTEIFQYGKSGYIHKTIQTAFKTINACSDHDNLYLLIADAEFVRIPFNEF